MSNYCRLLSIVDEFPFLFFFFGHKIVRKQLPYILKKYNECFRISKITKVYTKPHDIQLVYKASEDTFTMLYGPDSTNVAISDFI